jgi:hypothetical protein
MTCTRLKHNKWVKKQIQNFGGKPPWKITSWMTNKMLKDNLRWVFRQTDVWTEQEVAELISSENQLLFGLLIPSVYWSQEQSSCTWAQEWWKCNESKCVQTLLCQWTRQVVMLK